MLQFSLHWHVFCISLNTTYNHLQLLSLIQASPDGVGLTSLLLWCACRLNKTRLYYSEHRVCTRDTLTCYSMKNTSIANLFPVYTYCVHWLHMHNTWYCISEIQHCLMFLLHVGDLKMRLFVLVCRYDSGGKRGPCRDTVPLSVVALIRSSVLFDPKCTNKVKHCVLPWRRVTRSLCSRAASTSRPDLLCTCSESAALSGKHPPSSPQVYLSISQHSADPSLALVTDLIPSKHRRRTEAVSGSRCDC